MQPSQQDRRKKRPKKHPGHVYDVTSYARSIAEAIKRRNAGKPDNGQIPHWHPHQLPHTSALELKREAGLDVARAVLGHRSPAITEHYATLDIAKAGASRSSFRSGGEANRGGWSCSCEPGVPCTSARSLTNADPLPLGHRGCGSMTVPPSASELAHRAPLIKRILPWRPFFIG